MIAAQRLIAGCVVAVGGLCATEGVLREVYQSKDEQVYQEAKLKLEKNEPTEAVARWAVSSRNQAKVSIRAWDLDFLRIGSETRNQEEYGDPVGPSYEILRCEKTVAKKKDTCVARSDEEIIHSAGVSNKKVNTSTRLLLAVSALFLIAGVVLSWRRTEKRPLANESEPALNESADQVGLSASTKSDAPRDEVAARESTKGIKSKLLFIALSILFGWLGAKVLGFLLVLPFALLGLPLVALIAGFVGAVAGGVLGVAGAALVNK